MRTILFLLLLSLSFSTEAQVTRVTPTQCLQTAINDLESLLKIYPKATNTQIEDAISWVFDLEETSKRSLGSEWKNISTDQQSRFVAVFSKLLLKTYSSKLRKVLEVKVVFTNETVEDSKAMVRAIVTEDGVDHPFIFKLKPHQDFWRVYDLTIENVGLVNNYRGEFSALIRKEGIEGLIKLLTDKINS